MKKNLLLIAVWVCLFCISCGDVKNELIVCGDDKVLIIDADRSNKDSVCVVWEWKASDSFSQIPEELHQRCRNMDECKLVDNKTKILITSSSGIALLLDRETKNCLFYAYVPMAHSADFLPGNRIARMRKEIAWNYLMWINRIKSFIVTPSIPVMVQCGWKKRSVCLSWDITN